MLAHTFQIQFLMASARQHPLIIFYLLYSRNFKLTHKLGRKLELHNLIQSQLHSGYPECKNFFHNPVLQISRHWFNMAPLRWDEILQYLESALTSVVYKSLQLACSLLITCEKQSTFPFNTVRADHFHHQQWVFSFTLCPLQDAKDQTWRLNVCFKCAFFSLSKSPAYNL